MACAPVKMPGGGTAIVCGPRGRARKCCACSAPSTLLCDWKMPGNRTCDKPICRRHGTAVADDKDLCPEHAEAYRRWQAERMGKPL